MTFESQETVLPHWTGAARKKPRARSAIANGRKLIMADGRSMWAKRFIEICAGHCQDLGGFENLSQAELAIVKRAATLQVELENQETRLANGQGTIDLVEFSAVSNGLRRLLEAVGLKRCARECDITLAEIIREHALAEDTFQTDLAEQVSQDAAEPLVNPPTTNTPDDATDGASGAPTPAQEVVK